MEYLKILPENKRKELIEYTISGLEELKGYETEAYYLRQYIFNERPYIKGTHRAKQWLEGFVFEVIEAIQEYGKFYFDVPFTDFSDPESVVNMFVYVVGEEILCKSDTLLCYWGKPLSDEMIDKIIKEIRQSA